jgi:hypothetical protein
VMPVGQQYNGAWAGQCIVDDIGGGGGATKGGVDFLGVDEALERRSWSAAAVDEEGGAS